MQEGPPSLAGRPPSFDHVLGDARLSDAKPELEQFAVDARRTPKQILRAHLPDQRAQFCLDLRSPSPSTRFPTPIAAKAGPMPTHQRFGSNNHENRKDRREPAIELDEEPAVVVREASPAFQLASQDDQLMSKHCILRLAQATWHANSKRHASPSSRRPKLPLVLSPLLFSLHASRSRSS